MLHAFSGGFAIEMEQPEGDRRLYGPYAVDDPLAEMMRASSGYRPVLGPQMAQAELRAACHTLYTPYVDGSGQIAGTFPEQAPYLEWLHSDNGGEVSCQDCHMPPAQGAVANAVGGPPRSPFFQHRFVGGNVYMLRVLRAFGEDLGVTASSDHFEAKIGETLAQLEGRTATVEIEEATLANGHLSLTVAVRSLAGHKFPSGFPSRRAWLHVTVTDGDGAVVFESGGVGDDGAIVGNDNDEDPAAYEPHHDRIDRPDQVQIYEAILVDVEGGVTTHLLRAAAYVKDNRLLPAGFDKGTAGADFGVHGGAVDDPDFEGGGDRVAYVVDVGEAQGPFVVTVQLLYQAVGYRWARNLARWDAPEVARFLEAYDAVPNEPVVVAQASVRVER